jgi:hypothetical protein
LLSDYFASQAQLPHGQAAHRNSRDMYVLMPASLLTSAFGKEAWQQHGFKVMLSLHKDGACIAGGCI